MRSLTLPAIAIGSLLFVAACGGEDAAAPPDAAAETPARDAAEPARASHSPEASHCLSLVEQARYQQAIPACTRALELEPHEDELKQALLTAKAKANEAAAAAAARGGEREP